MKNSISFALICCLFAACTYPSQKDNKIDEQQYIMVDAKTRVYHDDGTRTYNDYKPFKTRTVEKLAGYLSPKELPKLSIYGINTNFKEKATGFFHVKKIGDHISEKNH